MYGSAAPRRPLKPLTTCCFQLSEVVTWGGNQVDLFGLGADHALWHAYWTGSGWSGWESLGGYLTSLPAAVSWGANRLDVFAFGGDARLWHIWWNGPYRGTPANPQGWSGWELLFNVPGSPSFQPRALAFGPNALDVFYITGSGLMQADWHGVSWQLSQVPDGGQPVWPFFPPAVVACGANCAHVFAELYPPGNLWPMAEWSSANTATFIWNGPLSWGAASSNDYDLSALGVPQGIDVFTRDQTTNAPYVNSNNTGWQPLGGAIISNLAGAVWGPTQFDVVGIGTDGALYHDSNINGWQGWQSLGRAAGNALGGTVFALAQETASLDVFAQSGDGTVWHQSGLWDTYSRSWGWGAWEALGHP
jgi:hypothetical protein